MESNERVTINATHERLDALSGLSGFGKIYASLGVIGFVCVLLGVAVAFALWEARESRIALERLYGRQEETWGRIRLEQREDVKSQWQVIHQQTQALDRNTQALEKLTQELNRKVRE